MKGLHNLSGISRAFILLAGIGALCALQFPVCADEPDQTASSAYESFDYEDDQSAYASQVAFLNRFFAADKEEKEELLTEPGMIPPEISDEVQAAGVNEWAENDTVATTVLVRTDGRELETVPEGLLCQIKGPDDCYTLFYETRRAARLAVVAYGTLEGILYAELDSEVHACSAGEGEAAYSFNSWGAEEMHFGSYLPYIGEWDQGQQVVAIVDSGVAYHTMLDPRITSTGYDYVDADDDPRNDGFGHGTHVAGIIVDCTQDLPVYLYPIRALNNSGGGKMSNLVNAIREASAHEADVINLSLESGNKSPALESAILDAVAAGSVVVAAAGNSNTDTEAVAPAYIQESGVIIVGSVEIRNGDYVKASYSNYGESVDLYAFGTDILSCSITGGYKTSRGTSQAAPHITAVAAMLRLLHPGLSPQETEDRIRAGATEHNGMRIPDLVNMIPMEEGIFLHSLILREDEQLSLQLQALPLSSCEAVSYESSDPLVLDVSPEGTLTAGEPGTALLSISCTGFEEQQVDVTVLPAETENGTILPAGLTRLEDEAFYGDSSLDHVILPEGMDEIGERVFEDCPALRFVSIPDSVTEIGDNDFSDAVVICGADGDALARVKELGMAYVCGDFI